MKNAINILILFCVCFSLKAQLPSSFSWRYRHKYYYVSDVKDQQIQGPCGVFAAAAAAEAMCQIYYNNPGLGLFNFAEAYFYNDGSKTNCPGISCESVSAAAVLDFAIDSGFIDEDSFEYPDECLEDCSEAYDFPPNQRVYVPNMSSWEIDPDSINTVDKLKQAILDYGPIIMQPGPSDYNGCALHPTDNDCKNRKHTVLFTGWSGSQWEIKDSWPDSAYIGLRTYNVFYFHPTFYRVYPVDPNNSSDKLRCDGSQYELFSRKGRDDDKDGFYSWGLESYGRPTNCPGPDLMDWNDGEDSIIFRSGDTIYETPILSGPDRVCQYGGDRTFELDYVPPGFSCSWYISENAYCFNTDHGDASSVDLYPNSSCIGKESEITFRITQNGDGGYAEYKKSFYVNGPREDLVSISVFDSYGGSPAKYGDTYYLCPYTTYYIYYNNYDYNCTTSDFDWVLPYSWTEYYHDSNYIIINTNDWPDGFLDIKAKTCCSGGNLVTVLSPYFGAAECGGYFMAYPNPSESFVDIDVDKVKLITDNISIDGECLLTIVDKSGMIKFRTEFIGFPHRIDTANLPEGLYFVNIIYKGKTSTIRLIIKH